MGIINYVLGYIKSFKFSINFKSLLLHRPIQSFLKGNNMPDPDRDILDRTDQHHTLIFQCGGEK